MNKKLFAVLIVFLTLVTAVHAQRGEPCWIKVTTEEHLYRGSFLRYTIGSIEIAKSCTLPVETQRERRYLFDVEDYGIYELRLIAHEINNGAIHTWNGGRMECKTVYLLISEVMGTWLIKAELYENGDLIDSKQIVWNFQGDSNGEGYPYRLRFSSFFYGDQS